MGGTERTPNNACFRNSHNFIWADYPKGFNVREKATKIRKPQVRTPSGACTDPGGGGKSGERVPVLCFKPPTCLPVHTQHLATTKTTNKPRAKAGFFRRRGPPRYSRPQLTNIQNIENAGNKLAHSEGEIFKISLSLSILCLSLGLHPARLASCPK